MNRETEYLLYKHYNINREDDHSQIILKAIHGAFLDSGRRGLFPVQMNDGRQGNLLLITEHLLSDRIYHSASRIKAQQAESKKQFF